MSDGYATIPDADGRTLRSTLRTATKLRRRFIQIATWNDWGEGTQIEPSNEYRFRDLKIIRRETHGGPEAEDIVFELPLRLLKLRRVRDSDSDADEIVKQIVSGRLAKAAQLLNAAESAAKN